ncbi:type III secretion system translocon subunit SctE [Acerihabitans arboris]|uniref:YopB/SseC family type III secretion system translocon subunit n=1 Tax=Acerihabitans arboris TaxID=2691583 RepID=A0A845SEZ7_9GAMM|nr:type III secretion system translocon subunit SctE [Acerihabitans arboris]NDL61514.1 YopB/SseC family type III secretion system translocon subunit [Acerihabitans arboris]
MSREQSQSLNNHTRQVTQALLSSLSANASTGTELPAPRSAAADSLAPFLTAPQENSFTGRFGLAQLFNIVKKIWANSSLALLADRLTLASARRVAMNQANAALAAEYQQAIQASEAALAAAEGDVLALEHAQSELVEKRLAFDKAAAALSQIPPEDDAFAAALQTLSEAQDALNKAETRLQSALVRADASYAAAEKSMLKLDEIYSKSLQPGAAKEDPKPVLNALDRLMGLILAMNKVQQDSNIKSLKEDNKFNQRMQVLKQEQMKMKSDEYADQVRKSEELNRTMGCVGKILGGLITLISVAGAIFSGGASLALAAVGLALMMGDEICKAVTGVSFMEQALRPLMEGIIKPLVDMISKAITKMLEGLGINANIASMVGAIIGALVAAALIVAIVVVGKSAGGKIASSALGKMLTDAVKKLVPDVLKHVAGQSGAVINNSVKRVMEKLSFSTDRLAMARHVNRLDRLNNKMMLSAEAAQSGATVYQGILQNKMAGTLADFHQQLAEHQQLRKLLTALLEAFSEAEKTIHQQWMALNDLTTLSIQNRQGLSSNQA